MVSLREKTNNKTLEIVNPRIISPEGFPTNLPPIQSVLGNQSPYTNVQYFATSRAPRMHSPAALDIVNKSCPMVSKFTLGLQNTMDFCLEDMSPRTRTCTQTGIRVAEQIVTPLSAFANLQHLELHFYITAPCIQYLHPHEGTQVAQDIYTRIQSEKQGVRLERVDIVLHTMSNILFGRCNLTVPSGRIFINLRVTMSCRTPPPSRGQTSCDDQQSLLLSCDLPVYGKILDRKNQADRLLGAYDGSHRCECRFHRFWIKAGWEWETGPRTWKYVHKDWPHPSALSLFCARARTLPPLLFWHCTRRRVWTKPFRRVGQIF